MQPNARGELSQALSLCRGAFQATAIFSFFINLLMFVSPLYMLQVYDRVLSSRSETTLFMLTLVAGFMIAVMGLLEFFRSRILVRAGVRIDEHLNGRVFSAVFKRSLRSRMGGGNAMALRDLDGLREFLTGAGILVLCDAPWAPLFIAVGFLFHPLLGWFTLGSAIIIFILAIANDFATRPTLQLSSRHSNAATSFAEGSLRNAEVLEAMGMMGQITRRWQIRHNSALAAQCLASDRGGVLLALSKFVRMFLQTSVLGLGAYLAINREISAGSIIAGSIVLGRALQPVEMAVGQWRSFVSARSSYTRLRDMLRETPAEAVPMSLPAPKGNLSVEQVVAAPPGVKTAVLRGVSFQLRAGEVLGVVGPSAAGKSTLARTLVGVWPIGSGAVRLDGADIFSWNREELGPHIGYLPQDVELFEGSVAENIARFGDLIPEAIVEAAQKAGVHDMILRLPDGYDTQIGVGGAALSGGQRQRVALARALYGNPAFVVLDEPNSNLDQAGEQALLVAVNQMRQQGSSVVVISHRLSILSGVDKVMVLNNGAVDLFGPRDEVMAALTRPTVVSSQPQAPAVNPPTSAPPAVAQAGA